MLRCDRASKLVACGVVGIGLIVGGTAPAALISPPWTRPGNDAQASADRTSYQHWNNFTSTSGPNAPDVAEINPNGTADAFDSAAAVSGSFVTSGGNIYSPANVIKPRVIVPGYALPDHETRFVVQVISQGATIDTADLRLDGVPVSSLPGYGYTELSRTALGGFGGFKIEHAWTFTAPADASSFQLDWGWGATSASLDQIAVDTFAVPVPEPLAGMAVALLVPLLRRNRAAVSRQSC
ncbi:MAG TPA: hypothetical protein VNL70_05230 [Tepidisphaeraceae bacterium]|nr:hypothetical protein [Tepidisphaeraceae bacterium]